MILIFMNNLEQIFCKDEKFIKLNGEEVNPKPVGIPKIAIFDFDTRYKHGEVSKNDIIKYLKTHFKNIDANAFLIGNKKYSCIIHDENAVLHLTYERFSFPVYFFKI